MSDGAQDGNAVDITTYEKQELLEKVIGKHKRLLGEYGSELEEIEGKVNSLNSVISSSKQKKEEMISKIDILTEKRQLFYHQAEKQVDELKNLSSDSEFQKKLRDISEEMSKVKTSLPPEDEKKLADSILEKLSMLDAGSSNAGDAVNSVMARVSDAIASSTELFSIKNSDVDFDKEKIDSEKELNELGPRHKWLMSRMGSHREALAYWEKQSHGPGESAGQADEVKA